MTINKGAGDIPVSPTLICKKQHEDAACKKIIDAIVYRYEPKWSHDDEEEAQLKKHFKRCSVDEITKSLKVDQRLFIPRDVRKEILNLFHDKRNHIAAKGMRDAMKNFFWPSMLADIKNYVQSCTSCAHRKGPYGRPRHPQIGHVVQHNKPFSRMAIDFIELPPSTNGFKYALTCLCTFSRFLIAVPLRRNRACDAARALYDCVFNIYDIPDVIESDRGTHFTSELMKKFLEMYGVERKLHVSWRPQSTGSLERCHRTLKNALFIVAHERRVQWDEIIGAVVRIINCSANATTNVSPFEAVFGRKPSVTNFDKEETPTTRTVGDYITENKQALEKIHQHMKLCQQERNKKMELEINPKIQAETIEVGDSVLLYRPSSAAAKRSKLNWIGPYVVEAANENVINISDAEGNTDWVHRSHICLVPPRKTQLGPPPLPFTDMQPNIKGLGPKISTDPVKLVEEEETPMIPDILETAEDSDEENDDSFQSCNTDLDLTTEDALMDGTDQTTEDDNTTDRIGGPRLSPPQSAPELRRSTRIRKTPEFFQS